MKRIAKIGSLLKKLYRLYNSDLLSNLQSKGFTDLRPSFLEILTYICDNEGASIKQIGQACSLKKQTMTSHMNELVKRGYVIRRPGVTDKREQRIFLTEYGEKFKFNLIEAITEVENSYIAVMGEVELERLEHILVSFHRELLDQNYIQKRNASNIAAAAAASAAAMQQVQ